ncbi:MAG: hypothetical protein DSZ06_00665 [Sulfurospirillum sp.]|nr:MAG: hypothetical protein DSZ06_00665 [Sulfurospirillum sp.]
MKSENYIAFFTVCGFFIGTVFSILKFDDSFDFLLYTFAITLFFYLFIHLVLVLFIKVDEKFSISFNKDEYEKVINEQISLLKHKEDQVTALLKSINQTKDIELEGAKS